MAHVGQEPALGDIGGLGGLLGREQGIFCPLPRGDLGLQGPVGRRQFAMLLRGLLHSLLGPLQFLVLHLEFDLVDLQFVDQRGTASAIASGGIGL